MTTYAFPTLTRAAPQTLEWGIVWNTQVMSSPLTQGVRTIEIPGARWQAVIGYRGLEESDAAILQAWLMQLRGRVNYASLAPWQRAEPRGTIAGTPLVNGASQTGATLNIDGCTAGTTLKAGDFFSVGGELKMVTADATANGSGEMAVSFEPPLRASPADNAAITTSNPTASFILSADDLRWSVVRGKFTDVSLQFIEVFS